MNGLRILVGLALASCLTGCFGYRIGNQSLFRPDVRTVHIPVFESDSFRQFLGERLTEAVIKEVESRSPYKVAALDCADSVIVGKLISDRKRVLIESKTDEARDIRVDLQVQVSWNDRYGRPLMKSQQIQINQFATVMRHKMGH